MKRFKLNLISFVFLFFIFLIPNPSVAASYQLEGVGFYAFTSQSAGSSPVYRLLNNANGDHFYTTSDADRNNAISIGYHFEGIGFYAFTSQAVGSSPVYRLLNNSNGDHLYTTSDEDKNNAISIGYHLEGIGFYAFTSQVAGSEPIYRFLGTNGDHLYTTEAEKNSMATIATSSSLGPEISVGIWGYTAKELAKSPMTITSNKNYNIKDSSGNILIQLPAGANTKISTDGSNIIISDTLSAVVSREVSFDSTDGNNLDMINTASIPSSFTQYRGKIKVRLNDAGKKFWVINSLPLEQYVWGIGEITGTGPTEYNKTMASMFRTYGYWKVLNSTKFATEGFKVDATTGSQLYYGYKWENTHPNIKIAAQATQGNVMMYQGSPAISPYSSWTDGRTRSFAERWKSNDYPWCQSVPDPFGKHPSWKAKKLVKKGNHMVGLSAHGALGYANNGSGYVEIINHYFTGINLAIPAGY